MNEKQTLKFILLVLTEQEKSFRRKNQLVQDSMWRPTKDKERYAKKYQQYLDAVGYVSNLLHTTEHLNS